MLSERKKDYLESENLGAVSEHGLTHAYFIRGTINVSIWRRKTLSK